jgi:transcriptional antiterminator RfaH
MNSRFLETGQGEIAWYCARTKPKHEHIAAVNLQKRLGLEVFHPRLKMERATSRGVMRVVEPLFPCYVFVRCEIEKRIDDVRHVTGISGLVRFGDRIPVVPDAVIGELQECFDAEEPMAVEDRFRPGMEVTVAEGAFMGLHGIVLRVMPAKQRIQILLDILGRSTLTEVDRRSLKAENRCVADLMPHLAMAQRACAA